MEDPVYSDLIWGEYEVIPAACTGALSRRPCAYVTCGYVQVTYSSLPQAAGGPVLRSAPGQLIFADQQLRQTLTPPGTLSNTVAFKSLGFFPGKARQVATIQPLTGTRYKVHPAIEISWTSC